MPPLAQLFEADIAPGFTLIADRMPGCRGVALGLWFRAGSAWESASERGLSHFVEHMVFKGAGHRDAAELSRAIDREGGYLNAFTEREAVCVHCLIPKESARLALEIIMDMAFRPRFRPDEFEREKDIIANEIMAAEDDLEETGHDEFYAMTYPDHPSGRRIAGSVDEVRKASFQDLCDFHGRYFAGGQLTLTVAGDLDPEELAAWARAGLPPDRPYAGPTAPPPPAAFCKSRRALRSPGSQIMLFTGLPLPQGLSEQDYWLLAAADSAYGESMSSRLFMRLRERDGLCYSVNSAYSVGAAQSLWGVFASTSPRQFPRFAAAYRREAESLHRDGFSEREVDEARGRLVGMLSLAHDDCEYRMKRLARMHLMNGRATGLEEMVRACLGPDSLNADALNAFVRDRLDHKDENILLYGKLGPKTMGPAKAELGIEGRALKGGVHG